MKEAKESKRNAMLFQKPSHFREIGRKQGRFTLNLVQIARLMSFRPLFPCAL